MPCSAQPGRALINTNKKGESGILTCLLMLAMRGVSHANDINDLRFVNIALDRANFAGGDVVVTGGFDVASTAAIADGGAIGKHKSATIFSHQKGIKSTYLQKRQRYPSGIETDFTF